MFRKILKFNKKRLAIFFKFFGNYTLYNVQIQEEV